MSERIKQHLPHVQDCLAEFTRGHTNICRVLKLRAHSNGIFTN